MFLTIQWPVMAELRLVGGTAFSVFIANKRQQRFREYWPGLDTHTVSGLCWVRGSLPWEDRGQMATHHR